MLAKILETLTGKDDLERVAAKGNAAQLEAYLKTRRLLVAQRPRRFLDASEFTVERLMELTEHESQRLGDHERFEPWIMEVNGKKRLPVFSSQKAMQRFSSRMSNELNKVFALACADFLIDDIRKMDVDVIDLNYCSQQSWELTIRGNRW